MKKHRVFHLFILIFCFWRSVFTSPSDEIFEFTAPLYNLSVEENSVGSKCARTENATKIGVRLPEKDANCKFRVAEIVGEKSSLFKAHARQIGDFVFLRIRYKGDNPLNRELKDFYDILVKATCKRRDSSNLETTARIHLRVIDRNDASPVFLLDEERYEATIDDDLDPFSTVLRVEASDADIGINSAIYYSLVNRSHDFIVEPMTGWFRTLRHVKPGVYNLKVKAEDRASRLYYFDENEVQPSWTADIQITVRETKPKQTKVLVDRKKINPSNLSSRQLAAVITLADAPENAIVGLKGNELSHWFEIEQDTDRWLLFARNGSRIPNKTNVTLNIGEDYVRSSGFSSSRKSTPGNTTATLQIEHLAQHSISFKDVVDMNIKTDEMAPIGRIVGRFRAQIENPNDLQLVRYSVQFEKPAPNATLPFSIGYRNGLLRVSARITGSSERVYKFKVIASLHGMPKVQNASCSASVEVLDANNNAPVWSAKWMRQGPIPISSLKRAGDILLKVDAVDLDEGDNGRVVYKLSSEESSLPVEVNASTGEISLIRSDLPKTQSAWSVTVWAVDLGSPMSRASALNLVFYKNGTKIPAKPKPIIMQEAENKNSPVFNSFAELLEVTEDAPRDTVVAKLQAVDEDVGYNGLVRYAILDVPGAWSQYEVLKVDEESGEVRVASDLSVLMKENQESVEIFLKVSATDAGNPPKTTVKTMKLRVVDVNNHSPEFDEPSYYLRVREDEKVGKELLKVTAGDFDGGKNGKVRLSLADQDDRDSMIRIQDGIITLKKALDRESQDVHTFTLIATDEGSPKRVSLANLTLSVDDVNDNAPKCVDLVSRVKIPEDLPHGAFVACVAASDADAGQNAKLKFSLNTPSVPFRLDHHSGCLFVHAPETPLDFRKTPHFNLSVEVADHGEPILSTTCHLHVELVDFAHNYLAIEFDDVAKEASVYENSEVGTEVIMVEAKEVADEKRKAENVHYSIIGGDGWPFFSIDNTGTVRTTSQLDREAKSAYWITIEAKDSKADHRHGRGTSQKRKAVLHVYIRILDRNDHRPIAKKPMYIASVPENSPANVVIVKVEATDADDVDNDAAAPLTFKIERGDPQSFFRIDLTSGYITTSGLRRLDRENQAEHELWVAICDGGEPQLCSSVVVIVTVQDENDNAPAFTQPIHHYNVRAGFVGQLCRIFAVDADAGENAELFYNITGGDSRFSIDQNGNIATSEAIHGDESYALTVQASDRGTPQQFTATRVVLTAIVPKTRGNKAKNVPPVITGKKPDYPPIPISDADQVGLTVGKFEATDADNDDLWWSISSGDENQVFDVRKDSGQLVLAKKVDNLKRGQLRMNISVTDGYDWDHTTVIIDSSRQISQRPKFSASHYQTDISERVAVGTQIYTLKASGEASGPGTKPLVYSLLNVDDIAMEDRIRVEPSSGNIIVMEPLDFESAKRIQGVVQVQQASMKSFATFVVNINDENDNAPQFVDQTVWATVDETDSVGDVLAVVTAFDKDSGENGQVVYSIVSGNEQSYFQIDDTTGEVRLARPIDRDQHVESILRIRASDRASNSLKDEMNLHIRNSNVSPGYTKFDKAVYQISLHDSTPPGTPVLVLNVIHHGSVSYNFTGDCAYFEVHALSGAVHLAKWLTKERKKIIECTAVVENSEGSRDEAKIIVKIIRTNQHSPVFRQSVYRGSIRENSPAGSSVLSADSFVPLVVSASDEDTGSNGLVGYRILSTDEELFSIDQFSGAIRNRKPLDFEQRKEYSFHVQASDMGQPARRSLMPALVIVTIIDENDELPKFESESLDASLLLPTASGVRVSGQAAKDVDTVGKLRYFIKNENLKKMFTVDTRNGDVLVKDAESLQEKTTYPVEVFASDGVRSTSYTLNVRVSSAASNSGFRFARPEYETSMKENTTYSPGAIILSVGTISDQKHPLPVSYSIINSRYEFFIHPGSGVISSTGLSLDRETSATILLVVQAKTIEKKPRTAQTIVRIRVEDVNDETPTFLNTPFDVTINSNSEKIGMLVLAVSAMDGDEGDNGKVQFSSSDLPDVFNLTADGKITLAKKLENIQEYEFTVQAQDLGKPPRSANEPVKIRVVDKERPVFEQNIYTGQVNRESTKKSTVLAKVHARSNLKSDGLVGYRIRGIQDLFSVDFVTGEVRLARSSRFLNQTLYEFEVEAQEVTRPKMSSKALVKVSVRSDLAEVPIFSETRYQVSVPESASPGHRLLTVQATMPNDKDDLLEYSINGDDLSNFAIHSETGEVTISKALDYESKQKYDLRVLATSSRKQVQSEAELIVIITDVNDEIPVFLRSDVHAQVDDAAIPGQFITIMSATDLDTTSSLPDAQKLLYKIVDGDETLFNVAPGTGEITLARQVEPEDLSETRTVKHLNVSVSDGMFTTYAKLSVSVLRNGAMQPRPRFEQSHYVANALENSIVNKSTLLTVTAKDGIPPIRYSLGPASNSRSVKDSWPVSIDRHTGRIHVSRVLNYHTDKRYQIPLVVEDATRRRAFSTLTLSVIDINDKPPVFVLPFYSTSISESAKEGDTVLMVSATDDDENDTIEYSLPDGSEAMFFSVHPRQGTITVAKKLEHKAGVTLSLTIKATDSANPPHHATTVVEINVARDNVKVPRFSNSHYLFSVQEDADVGNVIGRVQQMETEIDEVRFTIAGGATQDLPFSVERSTGKIIVKSALDRERKRQWKMTIRVDAAGGVHAITTVTVDVGDVNDNAPAFHGDYEKLTISEDAAVGTSVTIFSATDRDDSPSGKIRFSLVKEDPKFAMNEQSGWLTVAAPLDRETMSKYDLIARATDEGGFHTDLPFQIQVEDVNDSPPKFEKDQFVVEVDTSNKKALADSISTFVISDSDLPPNNVSRLFISSGNEEGVFFIESDQHLKVKRTEMLEKQTEWALMVTAFDGMFQTSTKVIVNVNKRVNAVKCPAPNSTVTVLENSAKSTLVLGDAGFSAPDITFELKEDQTGPFVMNFRNGIVKVRDPIDFEKTEVFTFQRIASTKTGTTLCKESITVLVENQNDNRPVILEKKARVSIKENLPSSRNERHFLTRVVATDADGDRVSYSLADDFDGSFEVDTETGVVTVVKMLDSETITEYNITVIATDGKFEDRAVIHVSVIDQNDHAPSFEKSVYSMKVIESESIGYELARIRASGGDANETVEFILKPSEMNKFVRLDKTTGVLTLAQNLDFETLRNIELTVIAKDSGNPPLESEARVEISVMDENDNAPQFENIKYHGKIKENAKIGSLVATVRAKDKDSEHFGSVSYSIESAKEQQDQNVPFVINEKGEIRTSGSIDYEKVPKYLLKVVARDGGRPPLSSEAIVEILVEDENDHSPVFEDCNMTAVVQESDAIGHVLLTFSISDADGSTNGPPFTVTINGDGAKSFRVTEDLRMVTTKKMQHSKKDKFLLTVVAKDVKGRETDCPLTVYIRQESRHAPVMKPMIIWLNTLQKEMQAGVVGKLRAVDEDAEDLLRFGIVDDSTRGPLPTLDTPRPQSTIGRPHLFRVDTNTGEIWSDHSIDAGLHTFNVTVSDGKFNTVSYVEVHVSSIDSDAVDHAVAIRIRAIGVDEFMSGYVTPFRKSISSHLNLTPDSIQLISVQEVPIESEDGTRTRRSASTDLEILMTAQRGHGRGFLKPDHIYSRIKTDFQILNEENERLRYQLITEMCTTGVCLRGECREEIDMIEDEWTKVSTNDFSFVSPHHSRKAQCLCPDGFGGRRCELEINRCSKSPCEQWQICIPSVYNNTYECACPLGMEGDRCAVPSCRNDGKCLEEAELSVGGDGYFEISLANEVETRMELEIELKTTTTNGIVMWSGGRHDYHMLLIANGTAEYHWDAGSGPGIVRSHTPIVDGQWHRIAISRRQRRTRMTVDDEDLQESFSPVGSTVLNLHQYSQKLVLGAKVVKTDEKVRLTDGVSACFKTIAVDKMKVPKTRQGMKLFGAQPGCSALTSSPCNDLPCKHSGTCIPQGRSSFICECPSRYSGDLCEVDDEPCASNPCPPSIQCIPFYNDYLCKCPNGFTGKHCESRRFEDIQSSSCSKDVCGSGQCIAIPQQNPESSDFICNCTGGILQSTPCSNRSSLADMLETLFRFEVMIVIVSVTFLILVCLLVFVAWKCCRKNRDPKYGAHCDVPHMRNTRVLMPVVPPPLPPRGFRNDSSNFIGSSATNSNRPMVQVKPFGHHEIRESRSPSACGSSKADRRELPSDKFRRADELSSSNRVRQSDRRSASRGDVLASLREGHQNSDEWLASSIDERLESALRFSRAAAGAVVVGDTELMPVINDDDYMTMKPRKDRNFVRDEEVPSRPPDVPAHAVPLASALYDYPISLDSQSLDDIDEEVNIHIS